MPQRHVAFLLIVAALVCLCPWAAPAQTGAKNVILMVADGAGYNTWRAASMYQGKLGKQVYDGPGWVHLACTTYALTRKTKPTHTAAQDPSLVYDPAKAWDTTSESPVEERTEGGDSVSAGKTVGAFAGYNYLKMTRSDSAATATAMSTGVKTFDNAINWTNLDQPLAGKTIAEIAKRHGRSVGVVTTVQWSHATPAALGGAHNVSRNNYAAIANEMLAAPYLDVIMGAGHPDFDDNGRPVTEPNPRSVPALLKNGQPATSDRGSPSPSQPQGLEKGSGAASASQGGAKTNNISALKQKEYRYVGGPATWAQLKSGRHPAGWTLIESKAAFERLATGQAPRKVLGVAQVATTLQQNRGKPRAAREGEKPPAPFSYPLNRNVPTLETMTQAALNCLDDNPQGFYLMVEGGAVDWANHANLPDRMIEEHIDFLKAVEAVVRWVETKSSWQETLVILTADHETGLIWGPQSDRVPFQPIVDCGPGNLPGLKYNSRSHTNSLVPLYARGPGSEQFTRLLRGVDPTAAEKFGMSGQYVDNTAIFMVLRQSIVAARQRAVSPKAPPKQPVRAG